VTTTDEDLHADVRPLRQRVSLLLALAATVPGVALNLSGTSLAHPLEALLYGMAIIGSAFLLSWAAEAVQLDISAGLAIAVLAFIAVLPEYAVSLVFARDGGQGFAKFGHACQSPAGVKAGDPSPCSLALANMTGSNRLLIGVGWSLVVFLAWWQYRKRGIRHDTIVLERSHSVELSYLAAASVYCLILPFKRSITLIDAGILFFIFIAYTIRISRAPAEEPHLVGPARWIGCFPTARRRMVVIVLFLVAAGVILLCAEHFAHALVETGKTFGVSEFLLVQWLAPLASEAPELLVAGLYAWRLNTNAGLGTLVSSKVNQWTLLIGTLPLTFTIAGATSHGLPIDAIERQELLLTAAQSVFAVCILADLDITTREATALFALFWTQFFAGALLPESVHATERIGFSIVYLILGAWTLARKRRMLGMLRDGFFTPYHRLREEPE
jgi:cation:H+ antiporter